MTDKKTVKQILIEAKALIADPINWAKNEYTEVKAGRICYCSLGAVSMAAFGEINFDIPTHKASNILRSVVENELEELSQGAGHVTFAVFNDNKTHAEVMAAFDKAIERA